MVTPYFLFGTNGTYKDLLSTDSFKPHKNITVFESITDRKTRVSRDAQNVCAVTIVGTALNWDSIHLQVVLETEVSNTAALRLYENLGFVRDKRLFRYYLNGVDALRLKLWLR